MLLFAFAGGLLFALHRAGSLRERGEAYTLSPPVMVGVQLFLCWLLYFYAAMALRENVLKVGYRRCCPSCRLLQILTSRQVKQHSLRCKLAWCCR